MKYKNAVAIAVAAATLGLAKPMGMKQYRPTTKPGIAMPVPLRKPPVKPKALMNALVLAAKMKRRRKNLKRLADHRKSIQNNPCLA